VFVCACQAVFPCYDLETAPPIYFPDSALAASATVIIKVIGSIGDSPNPYRW
jgi:hypothetical protein